MSVLGGNPLLLGGDDGYFIQRSIRLRSSATAYFSRTTSAASSSSINTFSFVIKRGVLGADQYIYEEGPDVNNRTFIHFNSTDSLRIVQSESGTVTLQKISSRVFRDPSAHYHFVVQFNRGNATAEDRVIVWVNGDRITSWLTNTIFSSTGGTWISGGTSYTRTIGATRLPSLTASFDGLISDFRFIDGQALTASSFGEIDPVIGVWKLKSYAGSYGSNGYNLKFEDPSAATAAAIGKDSSGNSNNWTPNNISVTAGVTYDSMLDVPTLTSPTTANFPVFNPVAGAASGSSYTITQGNLSVALVSSASVIEVPATMALPTSGKWYWEVTVVSVNTTYAYPLAIGISDQGGIGTTASFTNNYYYYVSKTGIKFSNGTSSAYGSTFTTNDVIGVAFDASAGTLTFYKNNTSQGTAYTGLTSIYYPKIGSNDSSTAAINFGQRPFTYTPPTGFVALNTYNLPAPTIPNGKKHFDIITWTGDGTTGRTLSGLQFQPDFVFAKARDLATGNPLVMDSVRGASKSVLSNSTSTELTDRGMGSFNSNGFTLDSQTATRDEINPSTKGMVGWNWKAGGTAVSNTSGSITSSVSANQTAGFSIVSFTGVPFNSSVYTIGHGLGVAPRFYIVKNRDVTDDFYCYHASLGATTRISLNTTAAATGSAGIWGSTAPTSLVFSLVGNAMSLSSSNRLIAYCFSEIAGYSKFGIYTGNGSLSGPFIYLGFRPRYVLLKRTDTAGYDWWIYDTERNQINSTSLRLTTNSAVVEAGTNGIDILANGFRQTQTDISVNASGGTYIYAAFAENPFKYSLAR